MIEHHVKEEEQRVEGMFSQARKAGLDMDALGEQMAAEKAQLIATCKAGGPAGFPRRRPSKARRSPPTDAGGPGGLGEATAKATGKTPCRLSASLPGGSGL